MRARFIALMMLLAPLLLLSTSRETSALQGLSINAPGSSHTAKIWKRANTNNGEITSSASENYVSRNWNVECVDCQKLYGTSWYPITERSIAVDVDNNPHIAFGGDHLYYARFDGISWQIEIVDNDLDVGGFASLALDNSGNPHISYHDSRGSIGLANLKYARYDGSTWQIEIVEGSSVGCTIHGVNSSLALDSAGSPHISYYSGGSCATDEFRYARRSSGNWQIETVDIEGRYTSLAFDSNDNPHISYNGSEGMSYAWHDGLVWQKEVIDTEMKGYPNSIAIDDEDTVHVSYIDNSRNEVRYARNDGNSWNIETVDNSDGNYRVIGDDSISLKLTRSGSPRILYYYDNYLKYAWLDNFNWQTQLLDATGNSASLALDSGDNPHITYTGNNNMSLGYAFADLNVWEYQTIDSFSYVADAGTTIALDDYGTPHISFSAARYWLNDEDRLNYYWRDDGDWKTEVIDEVFGSFPSLVIDESGNPHLSYVAYGSVMYASNNGTGWLVQLVDSIGSVHVFSPSLALDSNGNPHVSYMASGELRYAWFNGLTWSIEIIDAGKSYFVHNTVSLALDSSDNPHISYYLQDWDDNTFIKHAWNDGTAWITEFVDTGTRGELCNTSSLAIDQADLPHMLYFDPDISQIKYASYDGEVWTIKDVDLVLVVDGISFPPINSGCGGLSFALDRNDRPHIAYGYYATLMCVNYICPFGNLVYGYHDGDEWQGELVDTNSLFWAYFDISLALSKNGQPSISYALPRANDVLYAQRTSTEVISGQVEDGYGHRLSGVNVGLIVGEEGSPIMTTTTNEQGIYSFTDIPLGNTYRISVTLRDENNRKRIYWKYNGLLVNVQTEPFSLAGTFTTINVNFADPTLDSTPIPNNSLSDLASMFYHVTEVEDFATAVNLLNISDFQPVRSVLGFALSDEDDDCKDATAGYDRDAEQVVIEDCASNYTNSGRPMNVDWHENFHHLMNETIGFPPLMGGDNSHGGFSNETTDDSWGEGWAIFWPSVLWDAFGYSGPPELYRGFGVPISLEDNHQVWDDEGGFYMEEFAVASLLWDLYDPKDPSDAEMIDLSLKDLWRIISQPFTDNDLSDMRDVYWAFRLEAQAERLTNKDTTRVLPEQLDTLFILHGFHSDDNRNENWDTGEDPGWGGRPDRKNVPIIENAFIRINVVDENGQPVQGAELLAEVHFANGYYDYSHEIDLEQSNGNLVYLVLPPETRTKAWVDLDVSYDGSGSQTYRIMNDDYWSSVESSTTGYAKEFTFILGDWTNIHLPLVTRNNN